MASVHGLALSFANPRVAARAPATFKERLSENPTEFYMDLVRTTNYFDSQTFLQQGMQCLIERTEQLKYPSAQLLIDLHKIACDLKRKDLEGPVIRACVNPFSLHKVS